MIAIINQPGIMPGFFVACHYPRLRSLGRPIFRWKTRVAVIIFVP
jgi:hypothetical protein